MSKLAAICAKLQTGALPGTQAVNVVDVQNSKTDIFAGGSRSESNDEDDGLQTTPESGSAVSPLPQKRNSSHLLISGASRRKKSKPLSTTTTTITRTTLERSSTPLTTGSTSVNDYYNDSDSESDHDLHIDIPQSHDQSHDMSTDQSAPEPGEISNTVLPATNPALNVMNGLLGLYQLQLAAAATIANNNNNDSTKPFTDILPALPPVISNSEPSTSNQSSSTSSQYIRKYTSSHDCGFDSCGITTKFHYHCIECPKKPVLAKKEDVIRHNKWHLKKDESLQFGFSRFTQWEDCAHKFPWCTMTGKQTHYHCLQPSCARVYVSTSDVQMHANYHRKATAIIMEGFQRFRATDNCATTTCSFQNQRTTHFHCRRTGCTFTFKNKADMEKHKSYHQKDEILSRDGFKKFMKYEKCNFPQCQYSNTSNHIHCVRAGCSHVLHSMSQLYSHKRKHQRGKSVKRGRSFAAAAAVQDDTSSNDASDISLLPQISNNALQSSQASDLLSTVAKISQIVQSQVNQAAGETSRTAPSVQSNISDNTDDLSNTEQDKVPSPPPLIDSRKQSQVKQSEEKMDVDLASSLNLNPASVSLQPAALNWKTERNDRLSDQAKQMMGHFKMTDLGEVGKKDKKTLAQYDIWKKYLTRYTANDPCNSRCEFLYKDHYHCNVPNCLSAYRMKDSVREHARQHEQQEKISDQLFREFQPLETCPVLNCDMSNKIRHFHCNWPNCREAINPVQSVFGRLEHFHKHEMTARIFQGKRVLSSAIASKRRGRPPAAPSRTSKQQSEPPAHLKPTSDGYRSFDSDDLCPDELCMYRKEKHYHCTRERCYHVSVRHDVITLHCYNFHGYVTIPKNYTYFDRNVNCRRFSCSNSEPACHYHCVRPGCDYAFKRITTIQQHDKKHERAQTREIKTEPTTSKTSSSSSIRNLLVAQAAEQQQAFDLDSSLNLNWSKLPTPPHTSSKTSQHTHIKSEPVIINQSNDLIPKQASQSDDQPGSEAQNLLKKLSSQVLSTLNSVKQNSPPNVINNKIVKSAGTFFPKTAILNLTNASGDNSTAPLLSKHSVGASGDGSNSASTSNKEDPSMFNPQATNLINELSQRLLLQKKAATVGSENGWKQLLSRMYSSPESPCNSVFCKKKKVVHYHCIECGKFFNPEMEHKLRDHLAKHNLKSNAVLTMIESTRSTSNVRNSNNISTSNSAPSTSQQTELRSDAIKQALSSLSAPTDNSFLDQLVKAYLIQKAVTRGSAASSSAAKSAEVASADSSTDNQPLTTPSESAVDLRLDDDDETIESGAKNGNTEELPPPSKSQQSSSSYGGYQKYSRGENCGFTKCGHKNNGEHYHCLRDRCGYSVSDEARLSQHTQRHEKLDKLMGSDFKLYRINNVCGRADCEHSKKNSHFHCLLCPFICTDATRIMPHRKNHTALHSPKSETSS